MKRMLLAAVVGLTATSLMGQTAPGGVGTPVIWFKANDATVTADPVTNAVSSWKNSGSLDLTLSTVDGADAPTYTAGANFVNFGSNAHLADSTTDTDLWSVLNTHNFEVFIVSQATASGAFLYLGGPTATFEAAAEAGGRDILHNISFGSRGIYFVGNTTSDGESGFYGNSTDKPNPVYLPNVPNGQSGASGGLYITNIGSQPPYSDPNSVLYSLNGMGKIGGGVAYRGHGGDYQTSGSNNTIAPEVTYISLNGRKTATGAWARPKAGDYYEIIYYDRVLTTEERQKVLSYLGMKYNVYLAMNAGHNDVTLTGETVTNGSYFASDGTVIYARDAFGTQGVDSFYSPVNHSVSFIGRDDASGFVRTGDLISFTYLETGGKATPSNDLSFLTMSNNHGTTDVSTDLTANPVPEGANIMARSPKVWKITASNFSDNFNFVPAIGSSYGSTPDVSDSILLIVSPTPAFATGQTKGYKMQGRSFAGSGFAYWDNMSSTKVFGNTSTPVTLYFSIALLNGTTSALPVGLSNFTARIVQGQVLLQWHSNVENNEQYTVQRSINGDDWKDLAVIAGVGSDHDYSYTDPSPVSGQTNLYRIKQTDATGGFLYSSVKHADMRNNQVLAALLAYPNPTSGRVQLRSEISTIDGKNIAVYNVSGQLIKAPVTNSGGKVEVDLSGQASGIYFIRYNGDVVKVIKK